MKSKKAEMGMGTLIIFIAMILVAAMAAAVLIATTSKLQNKALDTGKLTTQEVGTGIMAVEVYGENGSNQNLSMFYETIKLSAGSEPLRFRDVLVTLSLDDTSEDYPYNTTIDCTNPATFVHSSYGFGTTYQIEGTSHKNGYLNKGDVVKVCFTSPRNVTESEGLKIQMIPKVGSIMVVETTTPDLMINTRVPIFP